MPILVKHGDKYYEIPDEVLAKSKVSKTEFDQRLQEMGSDLAEPAGWKDNCNFIDLSACKIGDL